ncbi:MAG: hypothetical protein QXL24_07925, partial [Candidatus Jordarchaeaceae archaeon]
YDIPEVRTFTELAMEGVREVEKMYGPVFTVKYIRYALWFIAQKIGEEPPQDVETIDQLKEYLISKADKYPTPPTVHVLMPKLRLRVCFKGDLELEPGLK